MYFATDSLPFFRLLRGCGILTLALGCSSERPQFGDGETERDAGGDQSGSTTTSGSGVSEADSGDDQSGGGGATSSSDATKPNSGGDQSGGGGATSGSDASEPNSGGDQTGGGGSTNGNDTTEADSGGDQTGGGGSTNGNGGTSGSGGTQPGPDDGGSQPTGGDSGQDGTTTEPMTEPSCTTAGTHLCGTECVSDTSPDSCGDSCTPCPAPTNGEATCNGGSCGTSCPNGTHLCDSACVDNQDPATCGGSCSPCAAPTGGDADCDGMQCIPTCPNGMKICEGACVSESTFCEGEERADGESCSQDFECESLTCEDGVCCNTACDGQCEACNLPGKMGTCAPSTTARAGDPCAGDGSSCSGVCDGSEEHRDSCVYPASGTLCGASASCSVSMNQARTAETCSGTGLCNDATVTNCSPYECMGNVCGTSCPAGEGVCDGSCVNIQTDPSHCGLSCTECGSSEPKCVSGACRECTSSTDCTWAGSGSVCDSNNTCRCRQPSGTNLLLNPGFDSSLANWDAPLCAGQVLASYDAEEDADLCPRSGAIELVYYGLCFGYVTQCRPVSANTSYRYGFDYRLAVAGSDQVRCVVSEYAGSTCSGDSTTYQDVYNSDSAADSWTHQTAMFLTSGTTGSVLVSCQVANLNTVWIDQIYLNATTNNAYF